MNYYQARQRKNDGLWHYTVMNDHQIWAVGYCAQGCTGHQTQQAAQAHFREWVLDNATFDGTLSNQQRKCEVCEAWTDRIAQSGIGMTDIHVLCDVHRTRDWLATVLPEQDVIISSW